MMSVRWSVLLTAVDLGDWLWSFGNPAEIEGHRPASGTLPISLQKSISNAITACKRGQRHGLELERAPYSLVKCDQTPVLATPIMDCSEEVRRLLQKPVQLP